MIQHVWSVLCSKASIDRETNNISLFEVTEQIQAQGPADEPGVLPCSLELVSLWSRTEPDLPSRGEARIFLRTPRTANLMPQTQAVDLQEYRRLRSRLLIPSIPIEGPGIYTFVVECRQQGQEQWVEVASIPLELQMVIAGPQAPDAQTQRVADHPLPQ